MVFIPRWERFSYDQPETNTYEVDYSNELTNALVATAIGSDIYDPITEKRIITPKPVGYSPYGASFRSTRDLPNVYENNVIQSPFSGATEFTIVAGIYHEGTPGNTKLLYKERSISVGVKYLTYAQLTFTVQSGYYGPYFKAEMSVDPGSANKYMIVACQWKSDGSVRFFVDGVEYPANVTDASMTGSIYVGATTAKMNILQHGTYGGTVGDFHGYFLHGYDKFLSTDEIQSLCEAPYQILKPRRKWYYFADAAGIQLLINNLSHNNTLDSVALAQANNLTPDNISQSSLLDNISLTQANSIAVNNLDNSNSLDNVTLSQSTQLQANNLSQSNALQSIALTQQNILSIDNSSQSVSIDNLTLNAGGTLTINNISQSNSIDNIALTQAGNLVVNDLSQSNAIDNIALIQANQLQINGLLNNVTIDNIALDFSVILDVNNANQSVSLENIVLTQAGLLAVSGLNQSSNIDNISLLQQSTLVVSDLLHDVLLDNITLIDGAATIQTNKGSVFVLQQNKTIFIINSEMNL